MQLTDFYFDLPDELIAQRPLKDRTSSRLMHVSRADSKLTHHQFTNLPDFLQPGDLLIFNNTRVLPARVFAKKQTGGKVEILLERLLSPTRMLAHVKASKSPKPGSQLVLGDQEKLQVIDREDDLFILECPNDNTIETLLKKHGHMPLPPYIQRSADEADDSRYQTVYAKHDGAVAAPTAGLHFDEALLKKLEEQGIQTAFVTLHVGAGTFQPIRVDDVTQHKMHSETISVPEEVCEKIFETKAKGHRVIAVGTTSVRALESAARSGELKPFQGETDIFIFPGFTFKVVDALITNFHLPDSSLMLLVSAFAGSELIRTAYSAAIKNQYRFYSYGDAMLIS